MSVRKLYKTPTLGGKFFWTDIAEIDGWRIQYNKTLDKASPLKPFRLLDSDDYLIASADDGDELTDAFPELAQEYAKQKPAIEHQTIEDIMKKLADLALDRLRKSKK